MYWICLELVVLWLCLFVFFFFVPFFTTDIYYVEHTYGERREKKSRGFILQCEISLKRSLSPSRSRPLFPSLPLSQWVVAGLVVGTRLQSARARFRQDQVRMWSSLHIRHLSTAEPRIGESTLCAWLLSFAWEMCSLLGACVFVCASVFVCVCVYVCVALLARVGVLVINRQQDESL